MGKSFNVDPALVRYLCGISKGSLSKTLRECDSRYFKGKELTELSKKIVEALQELINNAH